MIKYILHVEGRDDLPVVTIGNLDSIDTGKAGLEVRYEHLEQVPDAGLEVVDGISVVGLACAP